MFLGVRKEGEVLYGLTLPVDNLLLKRESVAVNKTKPFLPTHRILTFSLVFSDLEDYD